MATKKFDRTVWHGTDCDKVTSLFEYGLLVRYITKEKSWQCIYRNPHESNKFSYSWISEEDMREMFLTGWAKDDLKSFCSYVGDTWNDWLLRPVATRIYDFGNEAGKNICFMSRGEYADPKIAYNGILMNYWDVYDCMDEVEEPTDDDWLNAVSNLFDSYTYDIKNTDVDKFKMSDVMNVYRIINL